MGIAAIALAVTLCTLPAFAQDKRVEINDIQYSNQFEVSGGPSLRF